MELRVRECHGLLMLSVFQESDFFSSMQIFSKTEKCKIVSTAKKCFQKAQNVHFCSLEVLSIVENYNFVLSL